jgi:hypothetical protein
VLQRQEVDIHHSVDAVCQTGLLRTVELSVLNSARNALIPADLGELMGLGLDAGTLLLVLEELADLSLVLVIELLKVEVLDGVLRSAHDGGSLLAKDCNSSGVRGLCRVV